MAAMVVKTCRYRDPDLGSVHVRVHGTSRRMSARWLGQELSVTIPAGLSPDDYTSMLGTMKPRLIAMRPQPRFYSGQIIDAPLVDFTISPATQPMRGDALIVPHSRDPQRGKLFNYTIAVSRRAIEAGFGDPFVEKLVNKVLVDAASHATRKFVLPHARDIAARIGRAPLGWDVKETRSRLGCCSSTGIITLSPRLIFLPEELSDFIICHELAHLSEMNHSAAFHRLCNAYCGGREAELSARVKAVRYPVI